MSLSKLLESKILNLIRLSLDSSDMSYCGITKAGYQIPVILNRNAYDFSGDCTRILIIGGIHGTDGDVQLMLDAIETIAGNFNDVNALSMSYIPCLNYDSYVGDQKPPQLQQKLTHGFPPAGNYFFDDEIPESRYIWRWISYQAPDFVIELSLGESLEIESNEASPSFINDVDTVSRVSDDSLIGALGRKHISNLGAIPGVRITGASSQVISETVALLRKVQNLRGTDGFPSSHAVAAIHKRTDRTAVEVSEALASQFGYRLDSPINYVQGVGVSGRIRLAEYLSRPVPDDIYQLVDSYVDNPSTSFGDRPGSASLAGAVWADDLFRVTQDQRYKKYLLDLTDRFDSDFSNPPAPADPKWRTEDMFMLGSMMGRSYALTEERRYLDILTHFIVNMNTQQTSGLYWHDRETPFYWGRGNGFAVLGLAETLTYLPQSYPLYSDIFLMYEKLLSGLLHYQNLSGCYNQIITLPGSYQELTSTCMIGYGVARGIKLGLLDQSYIPFLESLWNAAKAKITETGDVVDGCTGTGALETEHEYIIREAMSGYDDRTGSLALWFSVEMIQFD
ncbi:MAG: glycoside hydrolase family 88 protein [Candidatus Poribacteria bacterium]|nr:glycoside hydrolase family 88 protein [Candidatus Poribacteria bacterium]